EPDWDSLKLFRVSVRVVKAAAARPEERDRLLDLIHALKIHLCKLPEHRLIVQTHGRYHHDHIYLSPEGTAVIDLDRSRPGDPAKDLAEFVRVLRMAAFKSGFEMKCVDEATDAFLQEYLTRVPAAAVGLGYYWSSFLLLSLFGSMKKLQSEQPGSQ